MRTVMRVWISLLLLGWAFPGMASWDAAGEVVSQTTEQVKQLLADDSLRDESELSRLYLRVDEVLSPVVNFEQVARGVMAKHYRHASDAQRGRFVDVFKGTLIKTYTKALVVFSIDDYKLVPNKSPSRKADREIVKVVVISNGQEYQLHYYMINGEAGWQLVNVVVDGVNLGQIFKRQFAEAMEQSGNDIDKVIDRWAELFEAPESKQA